MIIFVCINYFDLEAIKERLVKQDVKLVEIQRSRGYSTRKSLTIDKIEKAIKSIKTNMEKAIKRYAPVFVLPTLAAFAIGFIFPFIQGLYLSFCEFTTVKNAKFVGFSNYIKVFQDSTVVLENGEKLPISRNRKEAFGEEYMKYCWDREEAVEV